MSSGRRRDLLSNFMPSRKHKESIEDLEKLTAELIDKVELYRVTASTLGPTTSRVTESVTDLISRHILGRKPNDDTEVNQMSLPEQREAHSRLTNQKRIHRPEVARSAAAYVYNKWRQITDSDSCNPDSVDQSLKALTSNPEIEEHEAYAANWRFDVKFHPNANMTNRPLARSSENSMMVSMNSSPQAA
ncbi:uncharacterized protein IL334_006416 [Kwoniella shivajii]|uniref:TFIIS central domain-containing protein n=1 Tax=Kwoniella shivajii TaxID=564305 RepID=A0ABZ1D5W2_9TREE|nr:hypothetical protein IL334_006416 [Kwoniella shivajii]